MNLEDELKPYVELAVETDNIFPLINSVYFPNQPTKTSDKEYQKFIDDHLDHYNELRQSYKKNEAKKLALYDTLKYLMNS